MLRKFLDSQLALTEKGKPLAPLRPLVAALDTFLYEPSDRTKSGPHVRDAVDLKRWMMLVVIALLPAIFMAIWNTGVQSLVYSSGNYQLMDEYLAAKGSWSGYWGFVTQDGRWWEALKLGAYSFLPIMLVSYGVGGMVEGLFAVVRGHDIAEGFLVTGMLYPLVLPPTIPLWMVAVGVIVGIVLSKELFGGTGMNIMNPALTCRCFLFFTFPGKMSGDVWAGWNPTITRESLAQMNQEAAKGSLDAYTQATKLAQFNISHDIKRVQVDAIASNLTGSSDVGTMEVIQRQFGQYGGAGDTALGNLDLDQLRGFVTSPVADGGLGLNPGSFDDAYQFSALRYGIGGENGDGTFFFGDMLGSMGSTSALACILGAVFLVWVGIGSWRTMVAVGLGAFLTGALFQLGARFLGTDGGAWNPAQFDFPAYKHLILGGLAFGLVYMATDPVTSPTMDSAKWIYGFFIGAVTVIIRIVNPAYPEGVMLAILLGNVFAPLIDHYATLSYRRRPQVARV